MAASLLFTDLSSSHRRSRRLRYGSVRLPMTSVVRTFAVRYALPTDYRCASSRRGPQLFSSSIVTLNGFGLDDDGGVGSLPVLALGRDRPRDVAGTQSECCSQRRQRRYQHADDDFNDLLLTHNFSSFIFHFSSFILTSVPRRKRPVLSLTDLNCPYECSSS